MGFKTNLLIWIFICITLSLVGRLADYLFGTELRKGNRYEIQKFFGKIFDSINKVEFNQLQLLMIEYFLILKNRIFREKILTIRNVLITLLISQYLTAFSLTLSDFFRSPKDMKVIGLNYDIIIPFVPFIGGRAIFHPKTRIIELLHVAGAYWNNYLFDFLAMMTTYLLLKFVYNKRKHFAFIAIIDISLSYLLSYLCLVLYSVAPPRSTAVAFSFFGFIPELWHQGHDGSPGIMWLFYSLTTFVPIACYLFLLLFLSVSKVLQWIFSTIAHDFSKDSEKTAFFKLASAFSATALLIKAFYEILKSMN